jgi:hypothetical protein
MYTMTITAGQLETFAKDSKRSLASHKQRRIRLNQARIRGHLTAIFHRMMLINSTVSILTTIGLGGLTAVAFT